MTEILRTIVEADQRLALRRRGDVLELLLGNVVLLSSAALETERTFGRLAADVMSIPEPRILIGGLGFGATLRGVLDVASPNARVVVVEKLAAVIDVARSEAAPLLDGALADPRVELLQDDVTEVIARERDLSAILLDVDNGPEWASFRSNARLYVSAALAAARRALRPDGIFAVWSGYAKDAFASELRRAGFAPTITPLLEKEVVRARAYIGRKPA